MTLSRALLNAALLCILVTTLTPHLLAVDPPRDVQSIGIEPGKTIVRFLGEGAPILYEIEARIPGNEFQTGVTYGPLTLDSKQEYRGEALVTTETFLYEFRVRAIHPDIEGPEGQSEWSEIIRTPAWEESDNFRVFYNTVGCPPNENGAENCIQVTSENEAGMNLLTQQILSYSEGIYLRFGQLGFDLFTEFPYEADKFPINFKKCDGGGCARSWGIGLSPDSFSTYISDINIGTPATLATTQHEIFHIIQSRNGVGEINDPLRGWVLEGQARALQDMFCVPTEIDECENVDDEQGNFLYQVNQYLGLPTLPITDSGCGKSASPSGACGYNASLYWFFLCERYGHITDEPERGIDFMVEFYNNTGVGDGIDTINATLSDLGHTDTHRDAFKDFVLLNYTKDLPSVGPEHRYIDNTPQVANEVSLELSQAIGLNQQVGPAQSDVRHWAVKYYEIIPDPSLQTVNCIFNVESEHPAHFTAIAVRGGDIVGNIVQHEGKSFNRTFVNAFNPLDKIMVLIAGLEHDVNYNYSFNATNPSFTIVEPTTANPSYVGLASDPEKFVIKIKVLNPDGTPGEGFDTSNLNIVVGTEFVTNIIQSVYIGGGQHWLIVEAPEQPSLLQPNPPSPIFNLVVLDTEIGDSQLASVAYGDTPSQPTRNTIVIDRSVSMFERQSKIEGARNAAKVYLDSFNQGDKFSIASFSGGGAPGTCDSNSDRPLDSWNILSRNAGLGVIDGITSSAETGSSSIGMGLLTGLGQIGFGASDPEEGWAMFLLSDGLNNCGETIDDFMTEYNQRISEGLRAPVVHTLAIGPDANRPDLAKLSEDTGGEALFVSDFELPSAGKGVGGTDVEVRYLADIVDSHRYTAEVIRGEQRIAKKLDGGTPGEREHIFVVDGAASELTISITGVQSLPVVEIEDPDGGTNYPVSLVFTGSSTYKIQNPTPGFWKVRVNSSICDTCILPDYFIEASLRSSLNMHATLALPVDERIIGTPMPIVAAISDTGPVKGAIVLANIETPSNQTVVVSLKDDGVAEDKVEGDGVYTGVLHNTSVVGTYKGTVVAFGSSGIFGGFQRQRPLSFYMQPGTNSDGDCTSRNHPNGMPDSYEDQNGLKPKVDDEDLDSDSDGLSNCDEFHNGTEPRDCDSDDDGESDWSELTHGTDPNDPSDGTIRAPRAAAIPGVGKITLKFNVPSSVFALEIQKADPDGNFRILEPLFTSIQRGEYVDENVENGEVYSYRLTSKGVDGQSSCPTDPLTATPQLDPYPPHGSIIIAGGESTTETLEVSLDLFADDSFDPENEPEEPEDEAAVVSEVSDMMLSNHPSFMDQVWQPFQSTLDDWQLDPNDQGIAIVYAKFRDGIGNESEIVADSIQVVSNQKIPHLRIQPLAVSPPCDGTQELLISLDSSESVVGFSGTIFIQPRPRRTPLSILDVKVPDEAQVALNSLTTQPSNFPTAFTDLTVSVELDPNQGFTFGPGTQIPILIIEVEAIDNVRLEDGLEICFVSSGEDDEDGPVVDVLRGRSTESLSPTTECGGVSTGNDSTPPVIEPISDIEILCGAPNGNVIEFSVQAEDSCDNEVEIRCIPPSGTRFPIGTTSVECIAIDDAGNRSRSTFQIIIRRDSCFKRGDCNRDGRFNLGDPMNLLISLFRGGVELTCEDACDVNDDGQLELTDAVLALQVMFLGEAEIASPGIQSCGDDLTRDGLDCSPANACGGR